MIAAGVNVKAISTYMGPARVKITLDTYGHLMPNSEEEVAARLDEYLARASEQHRPADFSGSQRRARHAAEGRNRLNRAGLASTTLKAPSRFELLYEALQASA